MTDPITIITIAKEAAAMATAIFDAKDTLKDAHAKLQMSELIVKIAEMNREAASLSDALLDREREIRSLNDQLVGSVNMDWREPHYWNIASVVPEGPLCQRCWDADRKVARLHLVKGSSQDRMKCTVCDYSWNEGPARPIVL